MTKQRVDLNLLQIFYAVMTEQSVTRAARRLGITQPAVSNALHRLRQLFDDELFNKVRDGVHPTEKALAMWPQIEQAMDIIQSVTLPQTFDPHTTKMSFNVAVTESLASRVVPAVISRVSNEAPGAKLSFHLHSDPTSRLDLQRGGLDCAVGMFPNPNPELLFEPLHSDDYVTVVRRDYEHSESLTELEGFLSARHVLVRQASSWTGIVDTWLAVIGRRRRVVYVVNHAEQALTVVLADNFVTCLPRRFVQMDPRRDRLLILDLPFAAEKIIYKLAYHERSARDPAHGWMRRVLADAVNLTDPDNKIFT